jgi:hypothetical protein
MKKIVLLLIGLQSFLCFSQKECEYSTNVTDSVGTYKSTKDYIVNERFFGNTQTSIFFSLINAEGLPSLKVQLIQKSNDFIPAKCFDKNSKIFLQLNDGKIITLVALNNEVCGESIRNGNENNRVLTGYFLFVKDSFEALKKETVSIMRIKYASEIVDYIMKEELVSEIDKNTYYPNSYFVNYLKCIVD